MMYRLLPESNHPSRAYLMPVIHRHGTRQRNGFSFVCPLTWCREKGHHATFSERLDQLKRECKARCLKPFADRVPLEKLYRHFLCNILLSEQERGDLVLSQINSHKVIGQKLTLQAMNMAPLCQRCFALVMGLSLRDVSRKVSEAKKDIVHHQRSISGSRKGTLTEKGAQARIFLEELRKNGSPSPSSDEVFLGPWTKKEHYRQYVEKYKEGVSEEHFLQIWRSSFSRMKVVKYRKSKMNDCTTCTRVKDQIDLCPETDVAQLTKLRKELKEHVDEYVEAKMYYYRFRDEAKKEPRYLFQACLIFVVNSYV